MKKIYLSLLVLSLFAGCEKIFMEPNPNTNNLAIYDEYWKIVNEKFAMFDDPGKNIDRENLHKTTRAKVNENLSPTKLIEIMGTITLALKDGHSEIAAPELDISYFYYEDLAPDLDQGVVNNLYLQGNAKTNKNEGMSYKILENTNIGFIQYRDFEKKITTGHMNTILKLFKDTKGIILDVRGNGGGDPSYAALMASHFADKPVYIGYENFKTGPGINDFHKSKITLKPTSGTKYLKPLVVLTDVWCFSATTTLIYHLNPLPNVTFVGGKTGGGSGSTADGFLANGWRWQLSTSEFIDWEGRRLDNGFDPDIEVHLDENDRTKDEIIERAILELQ